VEYPAPDAGIGCRQLNTSKEVAMVFQNAEIAYDVAKRVIADRIREVARP
jgi:hypothetical protein